MNFFRQQNEQRIEFDKIQLKAKAQQVLCRHHNLPILTLNIELNVEEGDRIKCEACPSFNKKLIFLGKAEEYLNQWYQEEEASFEQVLEEFQNEIDKIQSNLTYVQKRMRFVIETIQQKVQILAEKTRKKLENLRQTQIQQILTSIQQSQQLSAQVLQDLAQYFSKQLFYQDQIQQKNKQSFKGCISTTPFIQIEQNIGKMLNINMEEEKINYQIKQLNKKRDIQAVSQYNYMKSLQGHSNNIRSLAISNDDKLIASGDWNGTIFVWSLLNHEHTQKFQGDKGKKIQALAFDRQTKYLISAQYEFSRKSDILIFLIDSTLQSASIRLQGHTDSVRSLSIMKNLNVLLSGSDDGCVKLWDLNKMQNLLTKKFENQIASVSNSPNEYYVFCGCSDGQSLLINAYNIYDPQEVAAWKTEECLGGSTFTQDSKKLITCHKGTIKMWDIQTIIDSPNQRCLLRIECQSYTICACVVYHDQVLITIDSQTKSKINFWNLQTGQLINSKLIGNEYENWADQQFVISSDLRYIITGGKSSTLSIFYN